MKASQLKALQLFPSGQEGCLNEEKENYHCCLCILMYQFEVFIHLECCGVDVIQPEMLKALEKVKVAWHTYPNCNPNGNPNADWISGAVPLD